MNTDGMKISRDRKEDYEHYRGLFNNLLNGNCFSRLGRAFCTSRNNYFYDLGTGKVFQVERNIFIILRALSITNNFDSLLYLDIDERDLFEALSTIESAVTSENILQAYPIESMTGPQVTNLVGTLSTANMVTLEVTERCNLRCKYCVYNDHGAFRTYGSRDMSFDVAKKAIDHINPQRGEKVNIAFYGGEPLLNFDLIKKCIEYSQSHITNAPVTYAMTTNCVLMTRELAKYFASIEGFFITVSLDGPMKYHDKNRVFQNGNGSFERTMAGLRNIVEALGSNVNTRLNINMVIDDASCKKMDEIQEFIDSIDWLPVGLGYRANYCHTGLVTSKPIAVDSEFELKTFSNADYDPFTTWTMSKVKDGSIRIDKNPLITKESTNLDLHLIHSRLIYDKPTPLYFMNGCCTPGKKRVYVTVDGQYKVCEKMGPSPNIGNVDSGFDIDAIRKYYVTDYIKKSIEHCSKCWAVRLCSLCYISCYDEHGIISLC